MAKFKKITGNFAEVIDALGINSAFYEPQAENAERAKKLYMEQVNKDLNRTAFLSDTHTVEEIKETLKVISHLYDESTGHYIDENKPLSYSQGGFDGAVFTELYIKNPITCPRFMEYVEGGYEPNVSSIRFTYVDDEGKNCAFSLGCLRDDSNRAIPEEKRKRFFIAAVIKNVNEAVIDREVTVFGDSELLANVHANDKPLAALPSEISKAINSKIVDHLLQGLIAGDSLSVEKFNEIRTRTLSNKNMDNRDVRIKQLREFLDIAKDYVAEDYLQEIESRIKNDFDFFKTGVYERNLSKIFETLKKNVREKVVNDAQAEELLERLELSFYAIRFELLAYLQFAETRIAQGDALLAIAERLNAARANPSQSPFAKIIADGRKEVALDELVDLQEFIAPVEPAGPPASIAPAPVIEKPATPKGLGQGFLGAHYGALAFGVGGLVTTAGFLIGGLLIMTGVLAPLGIGFTGLAMGISLLGALVAGVVGAASLLKMVVDENRFHKEMEQYQADVTQYEADVKQTQEQYQTDSAKFQADMQQYKNDLKQYMKDTIPYDNALEPYEKLESHHFQILAAIERAVLVENVVKLEKSEVPEQENVQDSGSSQEYEFAEDNLPVIDPQEMDKALEEGQSLVRKGLDIPVKPLAAPGVDKGKLPAATSSSEIVQEEIPVSRGIKGQ